MLHALTVQTWESALGEFLNHARAVNRPKTVQFYVSRLGQLLLWVNENQIPFDHFGKRHLDAYITYRRTLQVTEATLHHDAVCSKRFLAWCVRNDLLERDLLAGYKVPKQPNAYVPTPTQEETAKFLRAVMDFYNVEKHPAIKWEPTKSRGFHRDRNHAFFHGLAYLGCRIGELCGAKFLDYNQETKEITFRDTKTHDFRTVPVPPECVTAFAVWLKTRTRILKDHPAADHPEYLFFNESGGRLNESRLNNTMHKIREFAGLRRFSPHGLRHYVATRLSAIDLIATQKILGHKDLNTTARYNETTQERLRDTQARAGLNGSLLAPKQPVKKRLI